MSLRASGASAGLRPCHSPPGGLGVTTSEEQIRTSSLCPRLMVTRVTAEARIRQRGGSSTCDPGLPGSGHACRKRRPGAYCHLARGLLRTFEVIRVFSGCDGFFKFVFSTISLYCSQGCVCVCVRMHAYSWGSWYFLSFFLMSLPCFGNRLVFISSNILPLLHLLPCGL